MKTFTSVATLAVLLSSASAATITLETTPCLQEGASELFTFDVEPDTLLVKDLSVCGLKISAVDGIDTAQITCQAFKDAEGTEPGSSQFTYTHPALISTNPVTEGSVRCDTWNPSSSSNAITATVTASVSGGPDTDMTATVSASVSGGPLTTMTATVSASVSGGTGGPTGPTGGNGTVPSGTGQPQPTETWGAAAGAAKIGAGALVAGFAALLL